MGSTNVSFFVIFIAFVASARGQNDYCYADDNNPFRFFGSKTAYTYVRAPEISSPTGCSPLYMWALFRHGARYPTESDQLAPNTMKEISEQIVSNHETFKRGKLCKKDVEALKTWTSPWDEKIYGKLTPQGRSDVEDIVERWKLKFSDLFKKFTKETLSIQTSSKDRCKESAEAFMNKVFGSPSADSKADIKINDDWLHIEENRKSSSEASKFEKSSTMNDVLDRISSRCGYEKPISLDAALKMYKECAFETAFRVQSKPPLCAAFLPEDLKIFEYREDLESYDTLGHGDPNIAHKTCPLVRDLYEKVEGLQKNSNPSQVGSLNFGHSQTILPLLTKMGLFRDSEPLKNDNYEKFKASREWRTSQIDPFSANFIVIVYKCSDEINIMMYNNEMLIQYPGCNSGLCPWKSLKEKFTKEILQGCPQTSQPGASSSGSDSVGVHTLSFFLMGIFGLFFNKLAP